MDSKGTLALDSDWSNRVGDLIEVKLGVDLYSKDGDLLYDISDSDSFSRILSRVNKDTEFTYVDNESIFEGNDLRLVFDFSEGKLILDADIDADRYWLKVVGGDQ